MNNLLKKLFMILPILVLAALVAGFLPNILSLANTGGANQSEGIITQPTAVETRDDDRSTTQSQPAASRITPEEAREIALDKVDGEIVEFELDDNKYEVEIRANGKEYEFEINATTGKITDYGVDDLIDHGNDDDRVRSPKATAVSPSTKASTTAERSRISAEEARKIALAKINGKIVDFDLDDDKYEIEIRANGKEYQVDINAYNGTITEFEVDDLDDDDDDRLGSTQPTAASPSTQASTTAKRSRITAEQARDIALDKIRGTIVGFELDDDGYEIQVLAMGKEYQIEINPYTGKITKLEVEDSEDKSGDDQDEDDHDDDDDDYVDDDDHDDDDGHDDDHDGED